jgi:acyl-CoA thioesterase
MLVFVPLLTEFGSQYKTVASHKYPKTVHIARKGRISYVTVYTIQRVRAHKDIYTLRVRFVALSAHLMIIC